MKRLIAIIFALAVSCSAYGTKISESKHFQVYETKRFEKIVVKYGDKLTSPEYEVRNQFAGIFEIDDHQALLTRKIANGTNVNVNQLTLFRVEEKSSILNSIKRFFGKGDYSLTFKIYEFSNEEIFKQAEAKLRFDIDGDKIKVMVDNKEIGKLDFENNPGDDFYLGINEDHIFFSSDDPFDIKTGPRVYLVIAKSKEGTDPSYVVELSFLIDFSVKNGKLEFELKDPKFVR